MVKFLKLLPNILTFFRVGLIPVLVVLLAFEFHKFALIVFVIAAITDYLDGLIARKFEAVSNFGKLLDPMADKILVISALIMLIGLRSEFNLEPWVPAWMVVLLVAREVWVTGLRAIAASEGAIVAASFTGKLKSLLQMVAVCFLIYHDPFQFNGLVFYSQLLGELLLFISLFFSYWGAFEYSKKILIKS